MPGGIGHTEGGADWGSGGNPFASGEVVFDNSAPLGRGMADDGRGEPIRLADKAQGVIEGQEGPLTPVQAEDLESTVRPFALEIHEYRKDFVKVRAIFADLCTAISSFCEKRGFRESAAWFKDLSEAVKRGMSVEALRVARDVGESAKAASAHVSKTKPFDKDGRSV